jgi:hypothetical protein
MTWNLDKAVEYLGNHAQTKSTGNCAKYTRDAIEAGGVVLARHNSAKDYGISLVHAGFREAITNQYVKGDVVIIQGFGGHPHGHMAMFDGSKWISDFVQSGLYPGPSYREKKPSYRIYRYGVLWDGIPKPQDGTAYV